MKKNGTIVATFCVIIFGVIGVTLAYYRTNNSYTNEFDASKYKIKTEEVFESPTDWKPGDVTPKTVNVKNEGEVEAAVKVCFREKWEDKDGNELPMKGVILNYKKHYENNWLIECNYDNKTCFYYYKALEPNEITEDLLQSVEFDNNTSFNSTTTCTEDPTTHKKTCTSTINGYSGGKYTLYVDIETVQYSAYRETWGDVQVRYGKDAYFSSCDSLNIIKSLPNRDNVVGYLFTDKLIFKDEELSNYDLSVAKCETIYADSRIEENRYNLCQNVIYINGNNHQQGEIINLKSFNMKQIYSDNPQYDSVSKTTLYTDASITTKQIDYYGYSKYSIAKTHFPYSEDDIVSMNFSDIILNSWDEYGYINIASTSTFTMPNHGVIIDAAYYTSGS